MAPAPSVPAAGVLPRVVFFHRKPYPSGHYSLESIFADLRRRLEGRIRSEVAQCPFYSRGILRRLINLAAAPFRQGDINLITGDVNYLALLLSRRRTLLVVHDCGGAGDGGGLRNRLERWLWLRLPACRVAKVIAVSEFSRQEFIRLTGCDPTRVAVVPNPIGEHFAFTPRPFRRERPVLLQVGQAENKNLARILSALQGLPVRLSIIGEPTPAHRALLQASGLDFTCRHNLDAAALAQAYIDCDALLFPSTYEGFGLPIVEAQRTGRPVITSDLGPMPGVAGGAACLVDPFSVDSIRQGVLRVMEDAGYREWLVEAGRVNAERYDAARTAEQYLEQILLVHRGSFLEAPCAALPES